VLGACFLQGIDEDFSIIGRFLAVECILSDFLNFSRCGIFRFTSLHRLKLLDDIKAVIVLAVAIEPRTLGLNHIDLHCVVLMIVVIEVVQGYVLIDHLIILIKVQSDSSELLSTALQLS